MKRLSLLFFCLNFYQVQALDYIFEIDGGAFDSDFRWNIAAEGDSSDITSELEWKGLQGAYGDLFLRGECSSFFVFIEGEGAYATKGRVVDSDYLEPYRKGLQQRAVSDAKGTAFWGVRSAAGYSLFFVE